MLLFVLLYQILVVLTYQLFVLLKVFSCGGLLRGAPEGEAVGGEGQGGYLECQSLH